MKIEDYSKYYIQGSDHYLMPKAVFEELFNEMLSWKEESKKQKEDLKLILDYSFGEDASSWDKTYGEHAKATLKFMKELE